jgi:hypothetical protein
MKVVCALALLAWPGCGSGNAATPVPRAVSVPPRAATAGDALLASLPPGAEIVVEIDLARLRGNPVVGEMAKALFAAPPVAVDASALGAPLAEADAVVLAAYRVGTPAATTITVGRGGATPARAIELASGAWALAAEGDVGAILDAAGEGADLAGDDALLAIRSWAMPVAADGASLRITARLDDAARVALAEAVGVDEVPGTVSLWGDVADDLAVVARLGDRTPARGAPRWMPSVARLRDRLAAVPELGALGLARPIADADIRRDAGGVRVAVVIAPGRLRRAVDRWSLATSSGASP